MATIAAPFIAIGPTPAALITTFEVSTPATATVGQTFTAHLSYQNSSTPPDGTAGDTLERIALIPSCFQDVTDCGAGFGGTGGIDAGVFSLGPSTATGGAFAGITFTFVEVQPAPYVATGTITPQPGSGYYAVIPSVSPLPLAAGAVGTIDFPATVLKVPTHDLDGVPGPPVLTRFYTTATIRSAAVGAGTLRNNGSSLISISPAPTSIATVAVPTPPASATIGTAVHDTAQVTGAVNPTGTVTFTLFSDAACAVPVFTSTVPIAANGSATSGNFTPATTGTYHWQATYSGDANNVASGPTACADANEQVVITKANPAIATTATPAAGPIGTSAHDVATVSGLVNPGSGVNAGNVHFVLYSDAACATSVFTSDNPVDPATGIATSGNFTITQAGTYHWRATYAGDANNNAAGPTACLDGAEQLVVARATPTIVTAAAPPTAALNAMVTDTATVSNLVNPVTAGAGQGTVTFQLFSNAACTTLVGSSTKVVTVGGGGTTATATSDGLPVATAGTYHWVATYSGDVNNSPAGPTACADPAEQVVVAQATPTIATTATPAAAAVGSPLRDTATVTGLVNPTVNGTVTFQLFSDAACATQVFTSTNAVDPATGQATSSPFTATAPGTLHWVATYNGDVNNMAAGPTACADMAEQVVVSKASPTIATTTAPAANIGDMVHDTATVSGGASPTGTVTFTLFSDAACATQVFTSTNPVTVGTGVATSGNFTLTAAGTYHWVASYSGDTNNNAAGPTACADPAEQVVVAKASPTIATTASAPVVVGGQIFDNATVTGGASPTGTVTFQLFSDAACATQIFTSTNPLDPVAHTARSSSFTTGAPGTYHWIATYSGDANNNAAGPTACADPAEQVVVGKAGPSIATVASPAVNVGGTVTDTATVSGGSTPTGTVTFQLFSDAACATQVFTSTNPLNAGTGTATSSAFTTTAPGTLHWTATYNGDANNAAAGPTACADPAEQVVVNKTSPVITTRASSGVNVGGTVADVATVTGLVNPGSGAAAGTVTFKLFSDAACATQVFTSTNPLDPVSGTATSGAFTTTAAGTLHWTASYSGDANNNAAGPTACADPAEQVVVGPAGPSIVTHASPDVPVGGQITDTATLSGGVAPTGNITFTLFGPGNTTCTAPALFTSTVPVNGNGNYTSGAFTTTGAGSYRWVAVYSGDPNNAVAGPTACADPLEVANGLKVTPTLVTTASAGAVGSSVFDTATLSNAFGMVSGTITFQLFNNAACTAPAIFTSTKPVTGNGNVTSDTFILPASGVYHFVATYSGDANNNAVGPVGCTDPNETVGAGKLALALSTQASGTVTLGNAIFDTATVAGGFNPTGNLTFNLFGPDNATCTGAPVFTSVRTVNGNGSYPSTSFTPTAPGTYRWVASYDGDANNAAAGPTGCADPAEAVVVSPLPTIGIVKSVTPTSLPEPGGTFTFKAVVTNTSNVTLTIRSLTDNIYGDLTKIAGSTCNTAIGTVLAPSPGPGNTYTCTFPGDFRGPADASQTDTVTVTATDSVGNTVHASANATVTLTPVPPTITTTKGVTPPSLPEPGGTFTFTFSVTNTGPEAVTITSLVDDKYGDLNGKGNCAVGARLAPNGGTYGCTFTGTFFGDAGAAQTDTITTTGHDDHGQTVTSMAKATVTITNVPPTIQIIKTPNPTSLPEPGGTFHFTVTVTNTSFEPITTTSLVDNIYGDLNGKGTCATGVVLAANGGTYTCGFDGNFTGKAGDHQTDTVTVTAVDNDNSTVTAKASATVTITPLVAPPSITTTKVASPTSLPAPGGTFTFNYSVTNTGPNPVTITSLVDDKYGNLNGRGTCAVGTRLLPGATYTCSFTGTFTGSGGASQSDTITTTGKDDLGQTVLSNASATVTLTAVAPPATVPPVVVTPAPAPQVLVRTGADVLRHARLAGIFLLAGMTLVAISWRFGEGGGGAVPAPAGPSGGGGGGGGPSFGDGNWFGGARLVPPRGPGGGGGHLFRPPTPDDAGNAGGGTAIPPDAFLDVVGRPTGPPPVAAPPATLPAAAPAVADSGAGEALTPTVVRARATGGLDAAALDAAADLVPAPRSEPGRGRGRRFGGR